MSLPSFSTYCPNTTAANALSFDMGGGLTVWYSYKTPVAFHTPTGGLVVRENDWGPTTGKHLNAIDGGDREAKDLRVDGTDFCILLQDAIQTVGA